MSIMGKRLGTPIPRVQRVRRALVDGTYHVLYYYRPTRRRLPDPASPEFPAAYEAAEREFAETQQIARSASSSRKVLSPPLAPRNRRALFESDSDNKTADSSKPVRGAAQVATPTPAYEMPLYPDEDEVALAVLGPLRAHEWKAKAIVLERRGLPPIDPFMGGRFWLAVLMFFYGRNALDGRILTGFKSPATARIRSVPFAPDGREVLYGEEENAPDGRPKERRDRRSRI